MNSRLIQAICQQLALAFESKNIPQREVYDSLHLTEYPEKDLPLFLGDLITKARDYDLTLVSSHAPARELASLVREAQFPILYFEKQSERVVPMLGGHKLDGTPLRIRFSPDGQVEEATASPQNPYLWNGTSDTAKNGQALYLTAFPMESLLSSDEQTNAAPLTPVQRFFRLLDNERKDIGYIYLNAAALYKGLTLDGSETKTGFSNLGNNYKVMVDLYFPLFLRKERGKLQQIRIKQLQNDLDQKQVQREVLNEVNAAFNDVKTLEAQIRTQEAAARNQELLLIAEVAKFELGESSLFLVNSRESKLNEFRVKVASLRAKYEKALAVLLFASGVSSWDNL